jgi:hypothetical protein
MSKDEHPDLDAWLAFVAGRLPAARDRALRAHLAGRCVACERTRRWAERTLAAASETLEEPPAAVLSRARALFAKHRPRPVGERLREIAAKLLPPAEPALAGARDVAAAPAARTWEAGPYLVEVIVDPAPAGRRTTLRGRVVHAETGLGVPGLARLHRGGKPRGEDVLDDLGEVILRDVVVRDATLELLLEGDRVEIGLSS